MIHYLDFYSKVPFSTESIHTKLLSSKITRNLGFKTDAKHISEFNNFYGFHLINFRPFNCHYHTATLSYRNIINIIIIEPFFIDLMQQKSYFFPKITRDVAFKKVFEVHLKIHVTNFKSLNCHQHATAFITRTYLQFY